MRVKIIGVGGVGSHLADDVGRMLWWRKDDSVLTLVDGNVFSESNAERQNFKRIGNKAKVLAQELSEKYPGLCIEAIAEYLCPDNANFLLLENDVMLACVDNHPSRKLISDYAQQRENITVIAGGNEERRGEVLVYLRRNGEDVKPPLTQDHPEIAYPIGKAPYEMSCEELAAAGAPQIFSTNILCAAIMLQVLERHLSSPESLVGEIKGSGSLAEETSFSEIYFDGYRARVMSRNRPVKPPTSTKETENETAHRP